MPISCRLHQRASVFHDFSPFRCVNDLILYFIDASWNKWFFLHVQRIDDFAKFLRHFFYFLKAIVLISVRWVLWYGRLKCPFRTRLQDSKFSFCKRKTTPENCCPKTVNYCLHTAKFIDKVCYLWDISRDESKFKVLMNYGKSFPHDNEWPLQWL